MFEAFGLNRGLSPDGSLGLDQVPQAGPPGCIQLTHPTSQTPSLGQVSCLTRRVKTPMSLILWAPGHLQETGHTGAQAATESDVCSICTLYLNPRVLPSASELGTKQGSCSPQQACWQPPPPQSS